MCTALADGLLGRVLILQDLSSKSCCAAAKGGSTDASGWQGDPQHPGHKQQLTVPFLRDLEGEKGSKILACSQEKRYFRRSLVISSCPERNVLGCKPKQVLTLAPSLFFFQTMWSSRKALREQQLSPAPVTRMDRDCQGLSPVFIHRVFEIYTARGAARPAAGFVV